ncbi:MAG: hypothetical protein QW076_04045 [Candidatus Anstonellales archaeon]
MNKLIFAMMIFILIAVFNFIENIGSYLFELKIIAKVLFNF